MKQKIQGSRFTEDLRYFTWLREQREIKTKGSQIITEDFDILDSPEFLNESLRLSTGVAGELYELFNIAKERLSLNDITINAYIKKDNHINAACARENETTYLIYLTSALVEKMTSDELLFVIGHEIGHALFHHHDLPVKGIMSSLGIDKIEIAEELLRWSRMAEISADRVGLLCCRDLVSAVNAMLVLTSGLPSSYLNVRPEQYGKEASILIETLARRGQVTELYNSHPFNPLRIVALNMFWGCNEFAEFFPEVPTSKNLDFVNFELKSLLETMEGELGLTNKAEKQDSYKRTEKLAFGDCKTTIMIWGCITVAAGDGKITDEEIDAITKWIRAADLSVELNRLRISENPYEFAKNKLKELESEIRTLDMTERCSMLQKFVLTAKADGVVCENERKTLLNLCNLFNIPENFYSKILKYL